MTQLLTTIEAASILKLSPRTLYKWARRSGAPLIPVRIPSGRRDIVRWKLIDVERVANSKNADHDEKAQ